MSDCTRIDDYTNDGVTDWRAYREAQKANGEICSDCEGYISMIFASGKPRKCGACQKMESGEKVTHDDRIRCPHCGYIEDVRDGDRYELFQDGEHTVWCGECGKQFEISTHVDYSFTSPERIKEVQPEPELVGAAEGS